MSYEQLLEEAKAARRRAYTPYSGFQVGAALLTQEGKVYRGCNIENAAYGPTNCAERTAFFKAVSEGERNFSAIAIVGGKESGEAEETCSPCGVCRQVMMEFCHPQEFRIILADGKGGYQVYLLEELLPLGFGPKNLEKGRGKEENSGTGGICN
ncbi:MAG: cytidine deaminase [Lachnospiraceae bacterium]|nr:cytidine deaminase [Lachnospiraceae bacterium]